MLRGDPGETQGTPVNGKIVSNREADERGGQPAKQGNVPPERRKPLGTPFDDACVFHEGDAETEQNPDDNRRCETYAQE